MVSPKTQFATNLFTLYSLVALAGVYSTTFTLINKCNYQVWPAISSAVRTSLLSTTTGFVLPPGMLTNITVFVDHVWNGRIWGRTHCSHDSNGKFSCLTGDCASDTVECDGENASPPTTLANFTLNATNGLDFFQVSLVEGYNLPITVEPQAGNGAGDCKAVGCEVDMNRVCPMELKVMKGKDCVACRSACEDSNHCFTEFFSNACPRATLDPSKPIHHGVCTSTDYHIIFCASSFEAGKESDHKRVDKTDGQKKWSTHEILKVVGIVLSSIVGSLSIGFIVIKLSIHCSRHGCSFFCSTRARPPAPMALNP